MYCEPVCLRRSQPIPGSGCNSSIPSPRGTSNYPFCPAGECQCRWNYVPVRSYFDRAYPPQLSRPEIDVAHATKQNCHRLRLLQQRFTRRRLLFESVFADFCDYGGCHYLIVGDRLSGWVDIYKMARVHHIPELLWGLSDETWRRQY